MAGTDRSKEDSAPARRVVTVHVIVADRPRFKLLVKARRQVLRRVAAINQRLSSQQQQSEERLEGLPLAATLRRHVVQIAGAALLRHTAVSTCWLSHV